MAEGGTVRPTLRDLFGDYVLKGDMLERIDIDKLGGDGKVIGVYMSGHWCPPCKQFTPILAEWYDRFKEGPNRDNFEIIFVSSDKSDVEFMRYFMTMPWAALPFAERERKTIISKEFNVSGIPALVFINGANCELITNDGRSIVTEDVDGEDFPWLPIPMKELLDGDFVKADGTIVPYDDISDNTLGILFSAQWCAPCQTFQPQLITVYEALKAKGEKFEIIFASSDRSEGMYEDNIQEMPWLLIPFDDRRRKKLTRVLKVEGIPTVCIIGADGKVINEQARDIIEDDPDGEEFPWYPRPVSELNDESVDHINEFPCVIWLTDKSDDQLTRARLILEPISEAYHKTLDDRNAAKARKELIHFYFGSATSDDDVGEQLRQFAELPDQLPLVVILDVPNQSKYICSKKILTQKIVNEFLKGYKEGTLPKLELEM